MKNLLIALLLCPIFTIAQTEKINFTKKLVYISSSEGDIININIYYSPNGILIESLDKNDKTLLKSELASSLILDLDNNGKFISSYYGRVDSIPKYKFQKLAEKDQISGYACTYYSLSKNDSYYDSMKMCIAEDPSLDVISSMNTNEKDKVKGFPVAVSSSGAMFVLKSVKNYSNHITIDFKAEKEKLEENRKRYEEYYSETPADSVVVDSLDYPESDDTIYYTSDYKKADENDEATSLAINELEKDSHYFKSIPQYCTKIDTLVPEFNDKEITKHAKNYAGQLCDLYLSGVDLYSVDVKRTLDQIRYEENYFRNSKIDKIDKKLLEAFLNELD